jgi:RimJ/RimL family protein N-acetyltransferase
MNECPVDHPVLPELFDPHVPNNAPLWAVFEGRHAGRAVVDDLLYPRQCVVRTEALLTYASQRVRQEFLADAMGHFRKSGQIWLVRFQGDPPAPEGYRILPRLEFYEVDPHSPVLVDLRSRLPGGYKMVTIDRTLLERCEWRDDMAFYCGSLENFLKNGIGMCLMHGEEIIVEAYASALGSTYAEIGALTHEPYRGKGFAPIAVATLIDTLEKRGYQAYWSCDVDNPASARVARKLGFTVERPYEIWEYQPVLEPGHTQG